MKAGEIVRVTASEGTLTETWEGTLVHTTIDMAGGRGIVLRITKAPDHMKAAEGYEMAFHQPEWKVDQQHKDDGTCHDECWEQAVAEFEAARDPRKAAELAETKRLIELADLTIDAEKLRERVEDAADSLRSVLATPEGRIDPMDLSYGMTELEEAVEALRLVADQMDPRLRKGLEGQCDHAVNGDCPHYS